jgi:SAM-dependent methyltransferase
MFASLYHIHNSLDADDLGFWSSLARRTGGPILELGCGTGRVLLHLARAGYTVFGLDHSVEMLAYLKSIIPESFRRSVNIFLGDMGTYHLSQRLPLIILPCNTYTTLPAEERRRTLEQASRHLASDGTFALSIPNPVYLRLLPQRAEADVEEIFAHPADGEPVQVSSAWRRSKDKLTITWSYDHLLPDGTVERLSFQVLQHILPLEVIQSEFETAGLQITDIFGDFKFSPLSPDSIYLIITAQKY